MKTIDIWFLALTLCMGARLASAAPHLAPDSVTGVPGQTLRIPLRIAGADAPCSGFNATIYLPEGVIFTGVVRGPLLPAGFFLAAHTLTDPSVNAVALLAYSDTLTFSGPGTLCELVVNVPAATAPGDHAVILDAPDRSPPVRGSHALAGLDGLQSFPHTVSNGTLHLAFGDHVAARGTPLSWLAAHKLVAPGMTFDDAELLRNGTHGFEAWQEYIADTDPTNPASYFQILSIDRGPPLTVTFEPGSTGRVYTLLCTDGLTDGAWSNVPGVPPRRGAGDQDAMADPNTPPAGRFYRVRVTLP